MMKVKLYVLILMVISILGLSGCAYTNVQNDDNYLETYPQYNSGWYVNADKPILVINDTILINLIPDTRILGDWVVGSTDGDAVFTLSKDNTISINSQVIGEWYWAAPNILMAVITENDGSVTVSALRVDFLDGSNTLAQFSEYDSHGNVNPFMAMHVE